MAEGESKVNDSRHLFSFLLIFMLIIVANILSVLLDISKINMYLVAIICLLSLILEEVRK